MQYDCLLSEGSLRKKVTQKAMLLVGDVGATKTDLAIVSPKEGPRDPLVEVTFPSGQYENLEAIIEEFLAQTSLRVDKASIGLAAPVVGDRAKFTNLSWAVSAKKLQEAFKLSAVWLLNDLQAIANGILHLEADELHPLNQGKREQGGAIAVLAPGTGLGEGFLTWDGRRYRAHASEGSHVDFAPADPLQLRLLQTLWERYEHVSVERICSGMGLPNLYAALNAEGVAEESTWVADQLVAASDPTPIIVDAALDAESSCPLCQKTLELFVTILGAEAGNLALKVLATGGVYLAGGIPPRILPVLRKGAFMDAFRRKGRYADLLSRIPVHVVLNPKVALLGAACYGLESER